ncbi:MAG TPA: hypothetical protein DCE14_07915 [Kosmotogaceae bacterium]|nr:hypothetical protein [Kosmotogaceae bacterium]
MMFPFVYELCEYRIEELMKEAKEIRLARMAKSMCIGDEQDSISSCTQRRWYRKPRKSRVIARPLRDRRN